MKFIGLYVGVEEFNFYVPLGAHEKAKQVLDELFKKRILRLAKNPKGFRQGKRLKKN